MDWVGVFAPKQPILETIVRGTIVYLVLFTLLRVIMKRESGTVRMSDLLVIVLIADAAQNAMAGDYNTITDGLFLVGTIIFWSYTLDWLGYHFPHTLGRILHPAPLLVVRNGRMLRKNMGRELITEEELMAAIRKTGLDGIHEVSEMYLEPDGHFSVISKKPVRVEKDEETNVV